MNIFLLLSSSSVLGIDCHQNSIDMIVNIIRFCWMSFKRIEFNSISGAQGLRHPGITDTNYYDKIYFDSSGSSDEGEENTGTASGSGQRSTKKVLKLTNDELFYDPDMDDEDEKWINRQRMAYHNGTLRVYGVTVLYCLNCPFLVLF